MGAINLYMKAGLPARAARVALENSDMMGVNDVMERIAAALMKGGLYEKVTQDNYMTTIAWHIVQLPYITANTGMPL